MNTMSSPITVLIVDDHAQFRKALRLALEMENDIQVVGEATDWVSLERAASEYEPNIILMDLRTHFSDGITDGFEATRRICANHPSSAVIIVTMLADRAYRTLAHKAGAQGYVLVDSGTNELTRVIRRVAHHSALKHIPPSSTPEHYHSM
jgi:LuxR family maltose regulon positive regulatory protein